MSSLEDARWRSNGTLKEDLFLMESYLSPGEMLETDFKMLSIYFDI
jgi:hypothetical protein